MFGYRAHTEPMTKTTKTAAAAKRAAEQACGVRILGDLIPGATVIARGGERGTLRAVLRGMRGRPILDVAWGGRS
jgi:hypothetical protein